MDNPTEITPSPRSGRGYNKKIPIEKILELYRKNLTESEMAKILGCDRSNVSRRIHPYRNTIDNLDKFKNHRADILALNQQRLLNSITDAEIKKAPLGTKILATCQLYDKERLERGQSTENVSVKGITRNIAADVDRINQAIKALEDD